MTVRLGKEPLELPLSPLGHTWILDLDGTIVKHNGYKIDGQDSLIDGAKDFLDCINPQDMVILLTSRTEDVRTETELFLRENGIRFDVILYGAPYGERILINDDKPSGLRMSIAIRKKRDAALLLKAYDDETKAIECSCECIGESMNETAKKLIPRIRANKLVRIAVYPLETLHRRLLQKDYQNSDDSRYIKSLHNKYYGQRCFVIGNGPSLQPEDLDTLVGEVSFAANRIYHIFPQTVWRPTYYVSTDNDVISAEIDRIKSAGSYEKILNYKAKKYGRKVEENIHYINVTGSFKIDKNDVYPNEVSNDLSHHCSQFGTVTANSIELAIYMGFSEIYLLGVDQSYSVTKGKDGKVHKDASAKADYFAEIEKAQGHAGLPVMFADASNSAFVLLKKYADENGIKIFNATRGGKLEVFERVDFDKLMKKNGQEGKT